MFHQTPFNPKTVEDNINAPGIRKALSIIQQVMGKCLPKPLKAPEELFPQP